MGRKIKPPEAYLMKALEVFWQKGYEGASMSDLTEHIGIGAQSIYNKFGDKEGLYLATIQFFIDISNQAFTLTLKSKEDASLPEIVTHFAVNRRMQLMDNNKQSCYVVNCALELAGTTPVVENMTNLFFTLLKDTFKSNIMNAQRKGEIAPNKDPDTLGWYLVNAISSFGIQKKSGVPLSQIDKTIILTLSMLDGFSSELFYEKVEQVDDMYPMLMKMMNG